MEFLARQYDDILLDYSFIRAIGVQLSLNSEPGEWKRCDPLGGPSIVLRLARLMPFNN